MSEQPIMGNEQLEDAMERIADLEAENKALRKALETLAKTTNTPVLQPLHQIAKAALLKEGE